MKPEERKNDGHRTHYTADEIAYIQRLGTYRKEKENYIPISCHRSIVIDILEKAAPRRVTLLEKYISAIELRHNWTGIDKEEVRQAAINELAKTRKLAARGDV